MLKFEQGKASIKLAFLGIRKSGLVSDVAFVPSLSQTFAKVCCFLLSDAV